MEGAEEGLFDGVGDGHVVFDCVEAAEDDVEEADLGCGGRVGMEREGGSEGGREGESGR